MQKVSITSEIGKLKKVIVHRPGTEIENMTPETHKDLLFDDLLDLTTTQSEHDTFTSILKLHANVFEISKLLEEILNNEKLKEDLLRDLILEMGVSLNLLDKIIHKPSKELVESIILGVEKQVHLLTDFISRNKYSFPPLPNLLFTRDIGVIINKHVLTGSMANKARATESIIMKYILSNHKDMISEGFYFDDTKEIYEYSKFEGGDFLIIRDDVLAVGLSERTNSYAIDQLIEKFKQKGTIQHIFVVILPKDRAMIHLDMVFTMLDTNLACVHEPVILGNKNLGVVHIDIREKRNRFHKANNLISALKKVGIDLDTVFCGGKDKVIQEREQWMCGANLFTLAPGKVIGYARNVNTFEQIEKIAGIPRIEADDVLCGKVDLNTYDKYAIAFKGSELSRGGGGARCMTLPILRDDM